ncbi:MAG: hypothetical protein EPO25_17545 [Gammaproteobacteria bacterium]|nr:MAG: hypothetical protein EPO25_17545 [Gammaproteobacteria bacterium]
MKMFINGTLSLQFCLMLMFTGIAEAADQDPERYIYATYHYCDLTRQERADQIFEQLDKPVYDAAVADGTINSWGWLVHHTGGKWRRALYYVAPGVQNLLDAQKKIGDQIDARDQKLGDEFSGICNAHDDYIWKVAAGNIGSVARGGASFSVYHVCDSTREDQADAIMSKVFAPTLDRMVTDGKIRSWGWNEHIVGGEYRRLATISANDVKSLMTARGELIEAMYDKNPLGDTFSEICGPHADYLWEIKFSNP